MIDIAKLSPEPWASWVIEGTPSTGETRGRVIGPKYICVDKCEYMDTTDAESIALGHNALLVMLRRGWGLSQDDGRWWPTGECLEHVMRDAVGRPEELPDWPDPFTALVAADQWYIANVESKP